MAMDKNGGTKVTGIRQNVMLKGLLEKWQQVTLGLNCSHSPECDQACVSISPAISRRLMNSNLYSDSDEEGCQSPDPPLGVPKGYLAVYVGPELRRFIIPTSYLGDPLFKVLLEKVEEEFGFDHSGALTIPCEVETFKYLIQCMENHQKEQAQNNAAENSLPLEETWSQ